MSSTTPRAVIVDVLSVDSLWVVLRSRGGLRHVRYVHAAQDPLSRLAVAVLRRCGWTFAQLEYSLAAVNGCSPYKQLDELLIALMRRCREQLFAAPLQRLTAISAYERTRLSAFFGKQAGIELFFAAQLYIVLAAGTVRIGACDAICLRRSLFAPLLRELYGRIRVCPRFYRSWFGCTAQARTGYQMDRFILQGTRRRMHRIGQSLMLYGCGWLCQVLHRLSRGSAPARRHKICALVAASPALERRSCLPWVSQDNGTLQREMLAIHVPQMAPSAVEFYRQRCDHIVPYSLDPLRDAGDQTLRAAWAAYPAVFANHMRRYWPMVGGDNISRWMSHHLLEIVIKLSFFESLFRVQGVQVLWTMNEDDTDGWLAAVAVHRLGGVSAGTTWSQPVLPEWNIQRNQNDVYFVWGRRMGMIRQASGDVCCAFVVAGYPGDRHFAPAAHEARDYRARLLARQPGVRTVATFFNALPAHDALFAPPLLRALYDVLFGWLDEDPSRFLVIKAKREATLRWDSQLQRAIEAYQHAGRLDVLYDPATVYPALAADVVVGLGASLSLPSLAAALGCPVVLYDPNRILQEYPIDLPNVTVVCEANAVRSAMAEAVTAARGSRIPDQLAPRVGSAVDPFVDGHTARRYQDYVQDLLRALAQGRGSFDAIEYANQRHQECWGAECVMRGPLLPPSPPTWEPLVEVAVS